MRTSKDGPGPKDLCSITSDASFHQLWSCSTCSNTAASMEASTWMLLSSAVCWTSVCPRETQSSSEGLLSCPGCSPQPSEEQPLSDSGFQRRTYLLKPLMELVCLPAWIDSVMGCSSATESTRVLRSCIPEKPSLPDSLNNALHNKQSNKNVISLFSGGQVPGY